MLWIALLKNAWAVSNSVLFKKENWKVGFLGPPGCFSKFAIRVFFRKLGIVFLCCVGPPRYFHPKFNPRTTQEQPWVFPLLNGWGFSKVTVGIFPKIPLGVSAKLTVGFFSTGQLRLPKVQRGFDDFMNPCFFFRFMSLFRFTTGFFAIDHFFQRTPPPMAISPNSRFCFFPQEPLGYFKFTVRFFQKTPPQGFFQIHSSLSSPQRNPQVFFCRFTIGLSQMTTPLRFFLRHFQFSMIKFYIQPPF